MTELTRSSGVGLLDVRRITLIEAAAPVVPPEHRAAMDRLWDGAVRANPYLFDGPVVGCTRLERDGTDGLALFWARATYRLHALRRVPGATAWLPSLFVAVAQPDEDGGLLLGRMARWTAGPGRWQLPGGSVEPPEGREPLDATALREHAARELAEETGAGVPPDQLSLWLVTRAGNGNIGVLFRAPRLPASVLRERYAALAAQEAAAGREPELDRIAFVRSGADLPGLGGPYVDYLEPVVHRYAATARTG